MTFLYFAYGSNMLSSRLQHKTRCPSAIKVGVATATGYQLNFSKKSNDGSGKGSLVEKTESSAIGVIFNISKSELVALDKAEGVNFGYRRVDDFIVTTKNGKEKITTSYLPQAQYCDDQLKPYDWYIALVIAGAMEHNFSKGYLDKLKCMPIIKDPDEKRRSRINAIEALDSAGYRKWHELLLS